MTPHVARDALARSVRRVAADERPSGAMAGVFAVFEDHGDDAALLGVVTPHDVATRPGHIFADVLDRTPQSPIFSETPLDMVLARMESSGASALAVVDVEGAFIGAVTRESLWASFLAQDRALAEAVTTLRTRLAMADRMAAVGTMAAGIAHEINNPLGYVLLNLESLRELLEKSLHGPAGAEAAPMLEQMGSGLERIRRIVADVRQLARPHSTETNVTDIHKALAFAINMCAAEMRHCAKLVRVLGRVPLVTAEEGKLSQVFINLLLNATQAIPDGHADENEIRIRTATDDDGWAVIEISDSGVGMTEEVRARIFDPFFTNREIGSGVGLGLAICHTTLTELGGEIIALPAEGRGTLFRITLPPRSAAIEELAREALELPVPPGRFLVIDDEVQITSAVTRMLGPEHCTACNSGRDALELLREGERFDAILCDLTMPAISGAEVYQSLLSLAPDQARRTIMMTGGARSESALRFLASLKLPPLEKPFTRAELVARLHEARTS